MNRNRSYNPYNPRNNNRINSSRNRTIYDNPIIQELIISYNDNILHHNHIMEDYNNNIYTILNTLQYNQTPEQPINNINNVREYSNTSTANNPSRQQSSNLDLSSFFYLHNIPRQPNNEQNDNRYIALTDAQITNSTITTNYNSDLYNEENCPISLEEFTINEEICQIIGCGHYFKKNNIIRWFQNNHVCPVCRYNVRNYQQQTIDSSNNNIRRENLQQQTIDSSNNNIRRENLQQQSTRYENIVNNLLRPEPEYNERENIVEFNDSSPISHTNINEFSRIITDIFLEQIPTIDSSNNFLYSFEIPFTSN